MYALSINDVANYYKEGFWKLGKKQIYIVGYVGKIAWRGAENLQKNGHAWVWEKEERDWCKFVATYFMMDLDNSKKVNTSHIHD